jgi:Flp pilus assembly protein TadG
MRKLEPIRRLLPDSNGAAAVEFAIVSSVFFTFVIGIAYVGIMLFNNASLNYAVEDAARIVALNNTTTLDQIKSKINTYMTSEGLPSATVQYTTYVVNNVPTGHIVANYTRSYTLPFVHTFNITYKADAFVPLQSVIQS